MLDLHVQPRLALAEGQDNLVFPLPPENLSLSTEIVDRFKEDLGLAILSYGFSQAARWMLMGHFDISSRVPEFVLIAALAMSVLTTIFDRFSELFHPSYFSINVRNVSVVVASITFTSLLAKICHMHVSNVQGILFLGGVIPISTFVHQLFEE